MPKVVSFYGPKRRVVGAQLDLDGRRECWINPGILDDEDFQGLVQAQEQLHNGCSPKMKGFCEKLVKMYCFSLGVSWQEPERLFQEIAAFKKGFDVWL